MSQNRHGGVPDQVEVRLEMKDKMLLSWYRIFLLMFSNLSRTHVVRQHHTHFPDVVLCINWAQPAIESNTWLNALMLLQTKCFQVPSAHQDSREASFITASSVGSKSRALYPDPGVQLCARPRTCHHIYWWPTEDSGNWICRQSNEYKHHQYLCDFAYLPLNKFVPVIVREGPERQVRKYSMMLWRTDALILNDLQRIWYTNEQWCG